MQMRQNAIILLLVTSILSSPSLSQAATKPLKCEDVITACDKALEAKNRQLELSDLALKNAVKLNGEAYQKLEEKQKELDRWYRQPLLMFLLGAAAGGVTYTILKR